MTLLSNTDTASILCGALQLSGVHLSVLFWHHTLMPRVCTVTCNVQIYTARLQKFSDALTAENKNVFSFAVS